MPYNPIDIAGQMVLPQPVSAFIQGRAMAMAVQKDKLQQQMAELELKHYPEKIAIEKTLAAAQFAKMLQPEYSTIEEGREKITFREQLQQNPDGSFVNTREEVARAPKDAPDEGIWAEHPTLGEIRVYHDEEGPFTIRGGEQLRVNATDLRKPTERQLTGELLSTGAQTDLQKRAFQLDSAMALLRTLDDQDLSDTMTWQGRQFTKISDALAYIGMAPDAAVKQIAKDAKVRSALGTSFQRIRQEVTGAQAAFAELERLQKDFLDTSTNPVRARQQIINYLQNGELMLSIIKQMLREGIDPKTPSGGREFEARYMAQKPVTPDSDGWNNP